MAAVLALSVIVVVGQFVARRVSAPLDALVRFTHEVAVGGHSRAPEGDDEFGHLGASFNDMLDRLEHSQEALVRSEKLGLAGLLAARVAHDIRNPLSSIKMQAQLLQKHLTSADDRTALAAMLHDIGTVEAVIRDLLELARPGALKLRAESLNDVVRDALDGVAPQLTYRKIRVATDLDADLPPVLLDADRFTQALLNVIVNAADAMINGGTLEVRTRRQDRSTVVLDVCDDGVGLDPSLVDRVFDPFVSTKRDGVGLGLVNTKAVVESHGGRVTLEPRATGGTRATISLPTGESANG
jgi:signal transduction histidine kinase